MMKIFSMCNPNNICTKFFRAYYSALLLFDLCLFLIIEENNSLPLPFLPLPYPGMSDIFFVHSSSDVIFILLDLLCINTNTYLFIYYTRSLAY